MCLVIDTGKVNISVRGWVNKTQPTTENIKVWKHLRIIANQHGRRFKSPFRSLEYKPGEHYYQVPDDKNASLWDSGKFGFGYNSWGTPWANIYIDAGLHAYTNGIMADKPNGFFVEMIIPKGSIVFISGRYNEIVSDNLIWYEDCRICYNNKMYDNYESFIKNYKR